MSDGCHCCKEILIKSKAVLDVYLCCQGIQKWFGRKSSSNRNCTVYICILILMYMLSSSMVLMYICISHAIFNKWFWLFWKGRIFAFNYGVFVLILVLLSSVLILCFLFFIQIILIVFSGFSGSILLFDGSTEWIKYNIRVWLWFLLV